MSSNRHTRRWQPTGGVESLEGRELLTGGGIYGLDGQYINKFDYQKLLAKRENPPAPPSLRRVELPLPSEYGPRAKAVITLYGPGTLLTQEVDTDGKPVFNPNGTPKYVESKSTHIKDGAISVIFNGTTSESQIIGSVFGTRRTAMIDLIRDADVYDFDTTGVGTNQIGYINLARFDLQRGGRINLAAGVQRIFMNDIGGAAQIDVAALKTPPLTSPQDPGGFNTTSRTTSSGSQAVAGGSGQTTTSQTINGITVITTLPTTDQITISNGELTGVGGIILPGAIPSTSGNVRVEVQGVELIFRNVQGLNNPSGQPSPRVGEGFIAGLVDNDHSSPDKQDKLLFLALERNESTFVVESAVADPSKTITIQPPAELGFAPDTPLTLLGSGLGEFSEGKFMTGAGQTVTASIQVVAVGYSLVDGGGQTRYFVNAYSVVAPPGDIYSLQGWFEVVDPATNDPVAFDSVGGSSGELYLTKTGAGSNGTGFTQGIELTESLLTKKSVPIGTGLNSPASFNFKGGTAGVSGISFVYSVGVSYFTAWNPENPDPQLGIMKINVDQDNNLSVNSSTRIGGATAWDSTTRYMLGSVDQNLAMVDPTKKITDAAGTYYTAQMYDPNSLAGTGSFKIFVGANDTLSGLSESFNPELQGATVIDVRGNLKTFSASNTDNMVLNVNGIASYVRANRASNTEIIGHPILHLSVGWRPGANVQILSSERPTVDTPGGRPRPGTRGGVRIVKNLPILGPYVTPVQRRID